MGLSVCPYRLVLSCLDFLCWALFCVGFLLSDFGLSFPYAFLGGDLCLVFVGGFLRWDSCGLRCGFVCDCFVVSRFWLLGFGVLGL